MNIYHVQWIKSVADCGEYDECVVCADSEEEARSIHPNGCGFDMSEKESHSWVTWNERDTLTVKLIGVACEHVAKGLIVSAYVGG